MPLWMMTLGFYNFYPRPPGGGRREILVLRKLLELFLSTPSGWRATGIPCKINTVLFDFYPRPPGGGRLLSLFFACILKSSISIHALRVEGDQWAWKRSHRTS